MENFDEAADTPQDAPTQVRGLPPRTVVIERELALARRQLNGYTRSLRHDGQILGEEVEAPAEGVMRSQLFAEIERLERHLEALSTPVVMPDLVLRGSTETSGIGQGLSGQR